MTGASNGATLGSRKARAVLVLAAIVAVAVPRVAAAVPTFTPPAGVAPMEREDVLALTPEMRQWVHSQVPLTLAPRERLDLLIARLQAPDGAAMHYDAWFTASASSAFHERRFNCLSFSHLVIALAREIGLDAYYLQALYRERYDREGDLVLLAGHVTAGWGDGVQRWVVDFGNAPALGNARVRQLDDRRALALHYANLGAAFLRRGDTRSAMSALATALEVDPGTAGAWVNWGVALRRNGDVAGAEAAYRAAIEVEPSLVPGYANLYGLLRATGRTREAAGLVTEIGKLPNHDPWLMLAMGDECIGAGDLAGAERLYRQAHRAARDEAAPNAALAELALARGDEENARKWVRRAEELDAWEPRLYRLRAKLAMPQPPARTTSAGPPQPPPGAAAAPSPQPNRGSR